MNHTPQFSNPPQASEGDDQTAAELAACYARVFLGDDDGKRVMKDLLRKFPPDRLRFPAGQGSIEAAAVIDGQGSVMKEIQQAIKTGAPGLGLAQ